MILFSYGIVRPLTLPHHSLSSPFNEATSPSLHLSLNRRGRWGTTDVFTTSFLHSSLFSTTLWDLENSGPVHSLMLSSHLLLCLPCQQSNTVTQIVPHRTEETVLMTSEWLCLSDPVSPISRDSEPPLRQKNGR